MKSDIFIQIRALLLLSVFIFSFVILKAQYSEGDTIFVRVHDATDMTWHGGYSAWGGFPHEGIEFRKIIMKYTMGCASGGCSDWDYTTLIRLRHLTGEIDIVPATHPLFTVNGDAPEILYYCSDPTFVTEFNENEQVTDTVWNPELTVILYNIDNNTVIEHETIYVYEANYYNYYHNNLGEIIDSIFVAPCETLTNEELDYENHVPIKENFELARVITPYGGYMANNMHGFNNNWKFTSYFDVTDFSQLLRDSVEIIAFYDGWSSGFSVTLDFEFIVGTPPAEIKRIENLWSGGFSYASGGQEFNTVHLASRNIDFSENEKHARLRVTPSGHGFDNSVYCAEFCPRNYYVKINNIQRYQQLMWDYNCGLNPIFPQGGTWLYDRANWCPGLRVHTHIHDISAFITPGEQAAINIDVQNYNWSGSQSPYYYWETQLVTYGEPNFENDAEIYDIIAPSSRDEFARVNPICKNPVIVIRNNGSENLTNLDITYGREDGTPSTFKWTGNLKFMETDTVTLDAFDWTGSSKTFFATVSNPNGKNDEYEFNNTMTSEIVIPDVLDTDAIVVYVRTNLAASDNEYFIKDMEGNVIFERKDLTNNTVYLDTVYLETGKCYHFLLTDASKNGLSFWANSDGSGQAFIRRLNNWTIFKNFNPDFGTHISYYFTTEWELKADESKIIEQNIEIYPNPGHELLNIAILKPLEDQEIRIDIFSMDGKIISSEKFSYTSQKEIVTDISYLKSGIYFINISGNDVFYYKKFIKK